MKPIEKLKANEQREKIFDRDGWVCHHCGLSIYTYGTPQLAHKIPATKGNLKKYGKAVIHHPLNLLACCSIGICNDSALIGNRPVERENLATLIRARIEEDHTPGPSAE